MFEVCLSVFSFHVERAATSFLEAWLGVGMVRGVVGGGVLSGWMGLDVEIGVLWWSRANSERGIAA